MPVLSNIRWEKFFERKFLIALGGVITGAFLVFGQDQQAENFDKLLGALISVGMALGWITSETSRDNVRDTLRHTGAENVDVDGTKRTTSPKRKRTNPRVKKSRSV